MSAEGIGGFVMLAVVIVIVVILVRRGKRLAAQSTPVTFEPAQAQAVADRTNTLAILALVFGILGGYLAIIFGHLALGQIKRSGEQGRGLAITGLILGYFWVAVTAIIVIGVIIRIAQPEHG